jgi:UPF0716 family protein affecting phage T7 exclusion
MWLFFLFLFVPLIEIALFIQVGGMIGLWPTLGIVVATAVAGTCSSGPRGVRRCSGFGTASMNCAIPRKRWPMAQ